MLEDKKNHQHTADPDQCFFTVGAATQFHTFQVDHLVDTGFNYQYGDDHDWAVMKLKGHVVLKGMQPYRVDQKSLNGLKAGDQVVNVARSL
jgi:hypothetical protein